MDNESFIGNISAEDITETEEFVVAMYTMFSLTLVITGVSWLTNVLVIRALFTLTDDKLKVRFLLIHVLVSDMMLAGMLAFRGALDLAMQEGSQSVASIAFYIRHIIYGLLIYTATFCQIFATVAVALDRLYSISKPLSYHTARYTKAKKLSIIVILLTLSVGFSFPILLNKLEAESNLSRAAAPPESRYTSAILPVVLIFLVFLTLAIYFAIFVIIMYHRSKSQSMTTQSDHQVDRKQVSLVKTFFLVNLTYILLYLPGTLYNSVLSDGMKSNPVLNYYLEQLTIIIYLGNALVDPLIYILRIRSIRQLVVSGFGKCCATRNKPVSDRDVKTEMSTVSDFTAAGLGVSQPESY